MDAIVTVDAAQNVLLFNRAAEQIFGVRREEAIGGPLERFLPQRHRAAHHAHVEEFGRTGVSSRRMGDATTLWALRADGTEFPIEASISQAGEPGQHFYGDPARRDAAQKAQALRAQKEELRRSRACSRRARRKRRASRASCTTSWGNCSRR
jgi:PAS domain S-box-containing protein